MGRFKGRAAMVTGAGSGIGRATTLRLVSEGARVAALDLDFDAVREVASDSGDNVVPLQADVAKPSQIKAAVQEARVQLGRLDVLVTSAGVLRGTPAEDISPDEWDLVTSVNLRGVFLCCQAAFDALRESGGRIVNVASLAGRATSTLGGAHYTAAKAGVLGLSRHLAREWAVDGVAVNAISPGIVDTDMVHSFLDKAAREDLRSRIPFGRFADPGEIASLICFLASDDATYITGANVDIHGGELIIS